jgi:hypothetical protein
MVMRALLGTGDDREVRVYASNGGGERVFRDDEGDDFMAEAAKMTHFASVRVLSSHPEAPRVTPDSDGALLSDEAVLSEVHMLVLDWSFDFFVAMNVHRVIEVSPGLVLGRQHGERGFEETRPGSPWELRTPRSCSARRASASTCTTPGSSSRAPIGRS